MDMDLRYKWHHEKHDLPKPYVWFRAETKEGRMVDGYLTYDKQFYPLDKSQVEGLTRIVWRRWKYTDGEFQPKRK